MRAAVLPEVNGKVEVRDDVELNPVGENLVRVKIRATGVCHSDVSAINGTLPQPLPCVLGHEGAGEVVEVGSAVTSVAPGDHVIISWTPPCGSCRACGNNQPYLCMSYTISSSVAPNFQLNGAPLAGFAGIGTFAEEILIPASGAIKIGNDVPFDVASLIGCGVMTGAGAVINAAKVTPGSSVLVIGCGGVGISAIQGARIAGASVIVAVDMVDKKLEWAKQFGATHAVKPDDLPALMAELTGDGFDYTFEVVGLSATIRQAYDMTRRGGTCVVVGAPRLDDMITFSSFELFFLDKTIKSAYYGNGDVHRDFPKFIELWKDGKLDLEGMITRRIGLDDINDAVEALKGGGEIRQVIEIG